MAVTASDLRCRIQLYRMEEVKNELGETTMEYRPTRMVWASIVTKSGRSTQLEGGVEREEITHRVTVRRSSAPDPANGMRFTYLGQWYEVLYSYPIYNRPGWMELYCRLVVEHNG